MLWLWYRSPLSCLGWWPLLRWALDWDGKGFLLECLAASVCLQTGLLFSPERGSTLSCSAMGRKMQGGAMCNAARCVGRCSVLRRHLQRTAAFDRECSLVAGIAEGGGVHPPASQARGASLLVAQCCRHSGFCPSEYRSGRLQGSPDKPRGLSIQPCKSEKEEPYIRHSSQGRSECLYLRIE